MYVDMKKEIRGELKEKEGTKCDSEIKNGGRTTHRSELVGPIQTHIHINVMLSTLFGYEFQQERAILSLHYFALHIWIE